MNRTHEPHRPRAGPKPKPRKPTPIPGRPDRPAKLTAAGAAHWDEVVRLVEAAGLLSLLDHDSLCIYIDAWERYHRAKKQLESIGWVADTPHGPRRSPWYDVMMDAVKIMRAYGDRFGLTPLGRQRLKIDAKPDDSASKWAGFGVVGKG